MCCFDEAIVLRNVLIYKSLVLSKKLSDFCFVSNLNKARYIQIYTVRWMHIVMKRLWQSVSQNIIKQSITVFLMRVQFSKAFYVLFAFNIVPHCYKNYLKWSSPLEKCRPGNEKPPCWCRNILPLAHTDILHSSMLGISSGIWRRTFSVMLQENSVRASNYKC